MATLREVRARISGIKKTQKITKAMKMVAAAKLRRAQANVVAARPYARKIGELLRHLSASTNVAAEPLLTSREVKRVALVAVTSDRGLCGAFNSNLVKAVLKHINNHYPTAKQDGTLTMFCIGRKGSDFFTKKGYAVSGKYIGVYHDLIFGQAQKIARDIIDGYLKGDFDRVEVVYNEFKSIVQQRIVVEQFLPVPSSVTAQPGGETRNSPAVQYIYEPSTTDILRVLAPKHLNFQIWRILLESNAAEQGARMTAMDNATENANELISVLQLQYNKARQAAITKELLEVVSGAEALRKAG
jgi:F-type H+-transporting ATPase subunit gamma